MRPILFICFIIIAKCALAQNVFPTNGNVGIGTNSPGGKLEINHAGGQLRLTGGTVPAGLWTNTTDNLWLGDWDTGTKSIQINLTNGNIGIGSPPTTSKLNVPGLTTSQGIHIPNRYQFGISSSAIEIEVPGDSYNAIRGVSGNQYIGTIHFFDDTWQSGATNNSAGSINLDPYTAVTIGAWNSPGTYFRKSDGFVGIGTTTPTQKLTVNGTIYGKEVKVDLSVPGPDYVFDKTYKLPSLDEVKLFIDQNKHLPEVPSAKEMEANGINVSEMNMLLLKKVEELTLYLIDLKTENKDLKERITKIENKN